MSNSIVALIPARAGSKRVKNKNIREFHGHPLIAYTIVGALSSGVFDRVVVSTESEETAEIARRYGADVPFLRPSEYAGDKSPDIEWVSYTMEKLLRDDREYKYFSLLRPTSPFRTPETIQRAWKLFIEDNADSLRAVEKCAQHPYKMWTLDRSGQRMKPLFNVKIGGENGYSTPYQALPEIYIQNASLEISRTDVLTRFNSITGESIIPFITEGYEGFDINYPQDWEYAEILVAGGEVKLVDMN